MIEEKKGPRRFLTVVLTVLGAVGLVVAIVWERGNDELLLRKRTEAMTNGASGANASSAPSGVGSDSNSNSNSNSGNAVKLGEGISGAVQEHRAEGGDPSVLAPPSLRAVREEVARDPHHTPKIVLDFSRQLAGRMERAKASEGDARSLFDELQKCALGDESAISIRVLCLENARRLGRIWPASLSAGAQDLVRQAPKNVVSIVNSLDIED